MPLVHIFVYYLIMLSGSCDILCFKMKCMYRKTDKITTKSSGPMRVWCTWGSCLMITICCVIVSMVSDVHFSRHDAFLKWISLWCLTSTTFYTEHCIQSKEYKGKKSNK